MKGWLTRLPANERRTFWGCFAKWALDATDVQLSAFGGWIAGILADHHIGRVRVFAILSYALVLIATALIPETRGKELLTYE